MLTCSCSTFLKVPDRVQEFQIATLKEMGSNAWRTAHNPVTPEILDYCDDYGFLVWEENRLIELGVEPMMQLSKDSTVRQQQLHQAFPQQQQQQQLQQQPAAANGWTRTPRNGSVADPVLLQNVQDMVLRDRNHPSIVIWSLCNESVTSQLSPPNHRHPTQPLRFWLNSRTPHQCPLGSVARCLIYADVCTLR